MRHPLFTIPALLGYRDEPRVHPSRQVGSTNDWLWPAEARTGDLNGLLTAWTGLLRGLTLCGYRAVEIFVEADPVTATERLVLDVPTLGAGATPVAPDGLDAARQTGPALLVGITLEPLHPFGDPGGCPLALDLATAGLDTVDDVFADLRMDGRSWLGFVSDETRLVAARSALQDRGLQVAERLVPVIVDGWLRRPQPLGPPTGLGWLLHSRDWWFPPQTPDAPTDASRMLSLGLGALTESITHPDPEAAQFLAEQVVTWSDPYTFKTRGAFGRVVRDLIGVPPTPIIEAYRERVLALSPVEPEIVTTTAGWLDNRYTWIDAVLTMVSHGAIGALHNLVPGHPETADTPAEIGSSTPEWTQPCITGQWDAEQSTDTIILNQAGRLVSGFWQRRIPSSGTVHRYILFGEQDPQGADPSVVQYAVSVWDQPGHDIWLNSEAELGPPQGTASLDVAVSPDGTPRLTMTTTLPRLGGARGFVPAGEMTGAHHTPWTWKGLPTELKHQLRDIRDSPLHWLEVAQVDTLLQKVVHYVGRMVDERPSVVELDSLVGEFTAEIDDDPDLSQFVTFAELLPAARRRLTAELASTRPAGGDSYWSLLTLMLRRTPALSVRLQDIFGLWVYSRDGTTFHYRFKLTGIREAGVVFLLGGRMGTATLHLQQVDPSGSPISPEVTRTVDLISGEAGATLEIPEDKEDLEAFWPDKVSDVASFASDDAGTWNMLDPCSFDLLQHLEGATLSMMGFGASWLVLDSSSAVDVWITPGGGMPQVKGRIEADLVKLNVPNPVGSNDPVEFLDNAKKAKDLIDKGQDLVKHKAKGGKGLRPDLKVVYTYGWLRDAADQSAVPDVPPTPADAYVSSIGSGIRFETDKYELTEEFRDRVRAFCVFNLALLTQLNEMVIEGNASPLAPTEEYNLALSRDRAMSVLTAIYDILGPQLAVPAGSLVIRGLGSSQSTGDPQSDSQWDRRVDIHLAGLIRLQS